MPRRRQMTLIEWMVLMAIVGILAAIVMPSIDQAKRKALAARQEAARAPSPASADGLLNTIELSEVADSGERSGSEELGGVISALLPIAFAVAVIFVVLAAVRREMSRRAQQ
jgi:hypothetical protein